MSWDEVAAFLLSGRLIIYLLLANSIIAVAAILERLVGLRRGRVVGRLPAQLERADSAERLAEVRASAETDKSLLARVVRVVFESDGNAELIEAAGKSTAEQLEKRLILLDIVAVVSPLLGLLGTVLGMNQVFDTISAEGLGNVRAFSQGIALALRTTIIGLCVAIPAYVAHMMFERKADRLSTDMEYWTTVALEKQRRS